MLTAKEKDFATKLVKYYVEELKQKGFPVGRVKDVYFNTSIKTYGCCTHYNCYGYHTITLSEMAIKSKKYLRDTVIHELIHTMPNCQNHKAQFQSYARQLNAIYGTNISTYASKEESIATKEYRMANAKYVVRCDCCGATFTFQRKSKFVKAVELTHAKTYTHNNGKCGRHYTLIKG